ncbi:hypothetical protein [Sessilibacter sp. MAH4]
MKNIIIFIIGLLANTAFAEIPSWYQRDVAEIIKNADGVILYKVTGITLESTPGPYHFYRIESETKSELKGTASKGSCYMLQTEGQWKNLYKIGELVITIISSHSSGECSLTEPSYAAPGTDEYVSFFMSIIEQDI